MHIKELKVIVKVSGRRPSTEKIKAAAARLERGRNEKKSCRGAVANRRHNFDDVSAINPEHGGKVAGIDGD